MVATQIFFIFIPICGEMIQFDEHIFQMGWFNHHLVVVLVPTKHSEALYFFETRLSQEVSKRLVSGLYPQYTLFISRL